MFCVEYKGFLQSIHREFETLEEARLWVEKCGKTEEAHIFPQSGSLSRAKGEK